MIFTISLNNNKIQFEIGTIIIFLCIFYLYWTIQQKNNEINNEKNIIIQKLIRQSSRWAIAADQDKSPIIALLHANYAAGYLWALKDIASDIEIKTASNIDILQFTKKITDIQDKSTKYVSLSCPKFVGDVDKELAKLAGDM
jgi:hypothetical protein